MLHTYSSLGWGKIKHGVLHGSVLGPLLIVLYINDLPKVISHTSKPILFADNTNILISNLDPTKFEEYIISVFEQLNIWFFVNILSLNFDKTHY
jgi:hypothetical protein